MLGDMIQLWVMLFTSSCSRSPWFCVCVFGDFLRMDWDSMGFITVYLEEYVWKAKQSKVEKTVQFLPRVSESERKKAGVIHKVAGMSPIHLRKLFATDGA